MPDATIAWLCSDATYNITAIYNIVQQKYKSHSQNDWSVTNQIG